MAQGEAGPAAGPPPRESDFARVFDLCPDAMLITRWDDGQVIAMNAAGLALLGYRRDEVVGQSTTALHLWADPAGRATLRDALEAHPLVRDLELAFRTKAGAVCPVSISGKIIEFAGQECVLAIGRDISEHKQALAALTRAADRFASVLHANPDPILLSSPRDGRILDANERWLQVAGYTREEALGQTTEALGCWTNPADRTRLLTMLRAQGSVRDFEVRLRDKSGAVRDVSLSSETIELDGEPCLLTTGRDITARKAMEAALRQSQARFATVFQASPNPIAISRLRDDAILDVNEAWTRLLGYAREEVLGHTAADFSLFIDPPARVHLLAAVSTAGAVRNHELILRTRSGQERYISITAGLVDLDGEPTLLSIAHDLSEGRQAEAALRASEQQFRAVFDRALDALLLADNTGRYVNANPAAGELFGVAPTAILGRRIADFAVDSPPEVDDAWQAFLAAGHATGEFRIRRADGTVREVEFSATAHILAGQHLSVLRDITARKQAEAALRESEERFRHAFDYAGVGMGLQSVAGRWLQVNPALCTIVGYSEEELLARTVQDITHPEDLVTDGESVRDLLAGAIPYYRVDKRYIHKDGHLVWIALSVSLVRDSAGKPRHFILQAQDISQRKQAEDALLQRESTLRGIFAASPDRITVLGPRGERLETSAIMAATMDMPGEERQVLGDLNLLPHPEDREPVATLVRQILSGAQVAGRIRLRVRHATGHWLTLESHIRAMPGPGDRPRGAVVISRDVTRQVAGETELQQAKEAAEQANRAKTEFLGRLSHELRTPLNAILGFAQLLAFDPLSSEQRESVDHVVKAGRHLLALIDEILDVARVEQGALGLAVEPVVLGALVREVVPLIRRQAAQDQVQVQVEELTGTVLADPMRLQQVLLNLLSNAVKYNQPGGRVVVAVEDGAPGRLRLCVRDTGWGIDPEKLPRLFTPFDRLGAEQTGIAGTGLGLALSKRLVAAMGGTLGMRSGPDVGSTFWIDLPRAGGAPLVVPSAAVPSPAARTVLYIEDDLASLELVERILARRPGVRLLLATQGGLGLELARSERPDLILLDLRLPDLPGAEVLRRLRADPATAAIPVMVISAEAGQALPGATSALGVRAYLTKPLDVHSFLQFVDECLVPSSRVEPRDDNPVRPVLEPTSM